MVNNNTDNYYYEIILSYEIPYNVLDSQDPDRVKARENFYDSIKDIIPEDRYEKFSARLIIYQLKDTFNYLVTYEAFFRSTMGKPMEDYVEANKLKETIKTEFETFFSSLDCDYKQLNIKTLL